MTTLAKFITALVLSTMLMSCEFHSDFGFGGVRGNKSVEIVDRDINSNFSKIKVSRGLDVYITQGNDVSLTVEADENLHDIIITEVKNNILRIYADKNIKSSKSKKVILTIKDVERISASSGSDIFSTNTINSDRIELSASSGGSIKIEVNTKTVECSSSSGSRIRISGITNELSASASSGGDIKAKNLKTKHSIAKASSGSRITVNTSEELNASVSSGADIKYYGNPQKVNKKGGVSGSIRKEI